VYLSDATHRSGVCTYWNSHVRICPSAAVDPCNICCVFQHKLTALLKFCWLPTVRLFCNQQYNFFTRRGSHVGHGVVENPHKLHENSLRSWNLSLVCSVSKTNCGFIFIWRNGGRGFRASAAAPSEASVCGHSLAGIAGSNPAGAWMSVCCECCMLSGRGFCDELITCPEESYWMCCV